MMKNTVPYCHGEKMQAVTRYKSNGVVYRIFACNAPGCQHKVEVEWDEKPTEDYKALDTQKDPYN